MLELFILAFLNFNQGATPQDFEVATKHLELINPSPVPEKKEATRAPALLDEESVAVWTHDLGSGKTLFSKEAHRPQPIASLTKIMTFLIIYEDLELDEVVSVDKLATQVPGAGIELFQYERLTVQTLLEAILIPSANDAAVALAIHHSESEEDFVRTMNQRAAKWGLRTAKFHNPTGLDKFIAPKEDEEAQTFEEGHWVANEMSAYEVGLLTKRALKIPFFREAVAKENFFGTSVDEKFAHSKKSTNQLLGSFLGSKGVKTGFTQLAGQCLVHLSERDDGIQILSVVLGSPDRFQETKNILTWIWDNFVWR